MPNRFRYRRYLLGLLLLILAFNGVDRSALGVLLQQIKADLVVTDTQLGFLSGIAFALFYSVMGLPIARWADRGNRVAIIASTCLLWSVAVALCGAAGSFVQLLLIRVGVAVGEAGCVPPAHSLIAEYFSRAERARAVATYMMGAALSTLIGSILAGLLSGVYGWRMTFVLLGLPGLVLAALAWTTLEEPRFGGFDSEKISVDPSSTTPAQFVATQSPGTLEVCSWLWRNATFRQLLIGIGLLNFCGFGVWQWVPSFFVRSFRIGTAELGTWYAIIWGIGGMLGTYLGGALASRYAMNNEQLQLRVVALLYCVFFAAVVGLFLAPSPYLAFSLMGFAAVGICTVSGPVFATIQTLVPERMRAQAIAIVYLFANLVGMGLGPLSVGVLSDAFQPTLGNESLRYALLVLSPAYLWGAWHLWRASKSVVRDLDLEDKSEKEVGANIASC